MCVTAWYGHRGWMNEVEQPIYSPQSAGPSVTNPRAAKLRRRVVGWREWHRIFYRPSPVHQPLLLLLAHIYCRWLGRDGWMDRLTLRKQFFSQIDIHHFPGRDDRQEAPTMSSYEGKNVIKSMQFEHPHNPWQQEGCETRIRFPLSLWPIPSSGAFCRCGH